MSKNTTADDYSIAVAHCYQCKERQPVEITDWIKNGNIQCTTVHCIVCQTVLSLNGAAIVEYVTPSWLEERGWKQADDTASGKKTCDA